MHNSPQYALLQGIEQLRAEYRQRTQVLTEAIRSGALPADINERLSQALDLVERVFHGWEHRAIYGTGFTEPTVAREFSRALQTEWNWLDRALAPILEAYNDHNLSNALCGSFLAQVEEHSVLAERKSALTG